MNQASSKVYIKEKGEGDPILLIHGFPMHSAIWEEVSDQLALHFHVVLIDLPGFGQSTEWPEIFSLDDVAARVVNEIRLRVAKRLVVVGHSLGGYVTLAMAAQAPELLAGFCLLHSTATADSEEKKKSRTKTIGFIKDNCVEAFTSNFITPLFSNANHPAIASVRAINMESSEEAVVGYTKAMRDRPDRKETVASFKGPLLFITGDKDPGIESTSIIEQADLNERADAIILNRQAHMSLVEDASEVASIIHDFSVMCFRDVK